MQQTNTYCVRYLGWYNHNIEKNEDEYMNNLFDVE